MPDAEPIVAIDVLLLLHVPPDVPSVKVVVNPTHVSIAPEMAAGTSLLVITAVAMHPVGSV